MLRPLAASSGALCLAVIPAAGFAQEPDAISEAVVSGDSPFAPISARILSDPLYLPAKGQMSGATAFAYGLPVSSSYDAKDVKRSTRGGHTDSLSQSFAYGLTEAFSLHVSASYQTRSNVSTAATTGAITYGDARGVSDPSFGATYRLSDQIRNQPLAIDLTVNYAPNLIDLTPNSVAAGRQTASFQAGLGRSMRALTIQATASASYHGVRTIYDSTNAAQREGAVWTYAVGLHGQLRPDRRFSINGDVTYTPAYDQQLGAASTIAAHTHAASTAPRRASKPTTTSFPTGWSAR